MARTRQRDGYEEIILDQGERINVNVGQNETLENTLYNIEAEDSFVQIFPRAAGATVRNVGFKGTWRTQNDTQVFISPSAPAGSEVLIDHCYIGDPSVNGCTEIGIWVPETNAGIVRVRETTVRSRTNNGLYASDAGRPGDGEDGAVIVEDSFFHNNNITGVRLGSTGSKLINSTVLVDDDESVPIPIEPHGRNARCYWGWYATTEVIDSNLIMIDDRGQGTVAATTYGSAQVNIRGGNVVGLIDEGDVSLYDVGHRVITSPPPMVPMTAEQAAAGLSISDVSKILTNTTTIRSVGSEVNYRIEATDGIVQGGDGNQVPDDQPNVLTGTVPAGEEHWFWFSGEIISVETDTDISFFINGDPAQIPVDDPEPEPARAGFPPEVAFGLLALGAGIALSRRKGND